jgi:hypothetical protein
MQGCFVFFTVISASQHGDISTVYYELTIRPFQAGPKLTCPMKSALAWFRRDRRVTFIYDCRQALAAGLCDAGGNLIVRHGDTAALLRALAAELGVAKDSAQANARALRGGQAAGSRPAIAPSRIVS